VPYQADRSLHNEQCKRVKREFATPWADTGGGAANDFSSGQEILAFSLTSLNPVELHAMIQPIFFELQSKIKFDLVSRDRIR
jgi:hypothetical protein